MRRAFFLSYDDTRCEYLLAGEVEHRLEAGEDVVSVTFVTPYPPGFPVLVPGQLFSREILSFMRSLECTATGRTPVSACTPATRSKWRARTTARSQTRKFSWAQLCGRQEDRPPRAAA